MLTLYRVRPRWILYGAIMGLLIHEVVICTALVAMIGLWVDKQHTHERTRARSTWVVGSNPPPRFISMAVVGAGCILGLGLILIHPPENSTTVANKQPRVVNQAEQPTSKNLWLYTDHPEIVAAWENKLTYIHEGTAEVCAKNTMFSRLPPICSNVVVTAEKVGTTEPWPPKK